MAMEAGWTAVRQQASSCDTKETSKKEPEKSSEAEKILSYQGSDKEFYRLVKEQRKTKDSALQALCVNGQILESTDDICDDWATHFGLSCYSIREYKFDDEVKRNYTVDVNRIHNICLNSAEVIDPASLEEVQLALKRLKPNKAADSLDITGEHLIFGRITTVQYLRNLINYVFEQRHVPAALKEGLVIPIFEKGDKTDPANNRGITVTTVVLEVIEHILNRRHNAILDKSQSSLQKGFTPGRSSIDAALILSECIDEAKNSKKPLIVGCPEGFRCRRSRLTPPKTVPRRNLRFRLDASTEHVLRPYFCR